MRKVTYHIPTTEQDQEALMVMVKHLFPEAKPSVTRRATDTKNVDWQDLEHMDFADLLDAQAVESPFVTFTIVEDEVAGYTDEQISLLARPGIVRQYEVDPEEFLTGMLEDHPD